MLNNEDMNVLLTKFKNEIKNSKTPNKVFDIIEDLDLNSDGWVT